MSPEARLPRIIIVLLLTAGLAGSAHYRGLTEGARPVPIGTGDDLGDLILAMPATTIGRYYSLYVHLGDHAKGGVLVVPPDSPLNRYNAGALARVSFESEQYDPEISAQILKRLASEAKYRGVYWVRASREEYQYLIVDGEGPMRLLISGDVLALVPEERWEAIGGSS